MIRVRVGQFNRSEPSTEYQNYLKPFQSSYSYTTSKRRISNQSSGDHVELSESQPRNSPKDQNSISSNRAKVGKDSRKIEPEVVYRPSTTVSTIFGSKMAGIEEEEGRVNQSFLQRHRDLEASRPGSVKCAICGGVALFVFIFTIVIIVDSVHTIDEGMVGIYFVHGALMEKVSHPGVHWAVPFVTDIQEITIRPRTDTIEAFNTVTKDGIQNSFSGIQVLSDVDVTVLVQLIRKFGLEFRSALIFDRIKEELRNFCANHTIDEVYNTMFLDIVPNVKVRVENSIKRLGLSGIKILNLVIPKPDIPADIARNYKAVKVQWTEQLVATQQQKTEKIKKETETMKAVLDARRQKEVLEIDIEKDILKKEGEKKLSEVENEIIKLREQNFADVENYKKVKEAEANQKLYSADYVRLEMAKYLSNNTKFFFSGEQSPLGSVLAKIMGQE